jgi:hypothetical protein
MTTKVSAQEFYDLQIFKEHMEESRPNLRVQYRSAYDKFIAPLLDDLMEDLEEFVEEVGEEAIHDDDLDIEIEDDEE